MQTLIETLDTEYPDLCVTIHVDLDPMNPREWTQNGYMLCWHPDYTLGDEQFGRGDYDSMQDVLEDIFTNRNLVGPVLPLYLLDHSGITISAGRAITSITGFTRENPYPMDSAGWDTTHVGFIFATTDRIAETGSDVENMEKYLRDEVEEYAQYLEGDVYGYVIEDEDGNDLDSCWGYFGIDAVREEALAVAMATHEYRLKEAAEARRVHDLNMDESAHAGMTLLTTED